MPVFLQMLITAWAIILLSILLYLADKRGCFSGWRPLLRQVAIGGLFGILAAVGLLWGTDSCDVQDIAPLCAGLLFGTAEGLWTSGIGTVIFLIVATDPLDAADGIAIFSLVLSGIFSYLLWRYMYQKQVISWWSGLLTGMVVSTCHLLMMLWIHLDDLQVAHEFMDTYALPMILICSLGTMIAVGIVSYLEKGSEMPTLENVFEGGKQTTLIQKFRLWLLVCVLAGFIVTCVYSYVSQTKLYEKSASNQLRINMIGVHDDIMARADVDIINICRMIGDKITPAYYRNEGANGIFNNAAMRRLLYQYDITEASIINPEGRIISSTNPASVGYNMYSGQQSSDFMEQLREKDEAVQKLQPLSSDPLLHRRYVGIKLPDGNYFQCGYNKEQVHNKLMKLVHHFADNTYIGEQGGVLICDANYNIVSDHDSDINPGDEGKNLSEAGIDFSPWVAQKTVFRMNVHGVDSYCMYMNVEEYILIAYIPYREIMAFRNIAVYTNLLMELILFAAIFFMLYFLVMKLVVRNIHQINGALQEITQGNLDEKVSVYTNAEFADLSDGINVTVEALKRHIAEEAARIDRELEYARAIQTSSLPSEFPPWPDIKEFDIYAAMQTAKEVGGDFYDFFLMGNKLGFVIADVSGKGIPAALFMMTAKTQIKNSMQPGGNLAEAFARINDALCEHNDTNMFVTAFAGILDYQTGLLQYVNAGHTKSLLRHGDTYTWLPGLSGLPLAAMGGRQYRLFEAHMAADDILYMYTDGVTEAMDEQEELYGETRLQALLDQPDIVQENNLQQLLAGIFDDVKKFAGAAEQADDITMLAIKLNQKDLHNIKIFSSSRRS